MLDIIMLILRSFWNVVGQMAPYLLFGYLMAGILSVFVTSDFVQKHLADNSFVSIFKAALLGMPLPLCSCSVIPVTASLRNHGAGRGAVASFLISTPTTGVDSIMAAWAILGPVFALYRAVISVVMGVFTGICVSVFAGENELGEQKVRSDGSCCSLHSKEAMQQNVVKRVLNYAFITLPGGLTKPLFLGMFIASVISAFIAAGVIEQFLGAGVGTMFLMLAVGIPLYVCATASIPFALGFMALGASPGAALVFLIVGPATNAATITVLWNLIGKKATMIMLLCIVLGALGSGFLLDALWPDNLHMQTMSHQLEHVESNLFFSVSAVLLVFVQLWSRYSNYFISVFTGKEVIASSCCSGEHSHNGHHDHGHTVSHENNSRGGSVSVQKNIETERYSEKHSKCDCFNKKDDCCGSEKNE